MRDGSLVEYQMPITDRVCASQPWASTFPARMEYALSQGPLPRGPCPPCPEVVSQWLQARAHEYSYLTLNYVEGGKKQSMLLKFRLTGGTLYVDEGSAVLRFSKKRARRKHKH